MKRVHAVKLLLNDEEMIDLQRQAIAMDMPVAEVARRNMVAHMWGILGQACRRRNRHRGADEELQGSDFLHSELDDGIGGS